MNNQDRAAQVWNEAKIEHTKYIGLARNRNAAAIIAAYGQERYRAGVEAMRNKTFEMYRAGEYVHVARMTFWDYLQRQADKLLAEQEKK